MSRAALVRTRVRARRPSTFVVVLTALQVLGAGCADDFSKGWLVDRVRVLGALAHPADRPETSSLAPGDRARITWLVAPPERPPARMGWAFAVCAPPPGNFAEPACAAPAGEGRGEAIAVEGETSGTELVPMDIDVPRDLGAELLVIAAFCADGAAALDAPSFTARCSGGAEPLLASTVLEVGAERPNANPAVGDDAVTLDGAPLPLLGARPRCGDPSVRDVRASADLELGFRFDEAAREAGETLVVTHVVTAGELVRQYSALEPSEPTPKAVKLTWTAPAADAADGSLSFFYFVLRDGRGGVAFARRAVCVRRP